jgi:hypothetical protein
MKKIQIRDLNPKAQEVYEYFERQAGSEHIASPWAMQVLFNILKQDKPKTILEFGGGIGTMSYLCLQCSDAEIDIYENNTFCIDALRSNLKEFEGRYRILTDYSDSRLPHDSYDLVLCDGGPYSLTGDIVEKTKYIKRIFFEGRRFPLQALFRRALRDKYVFSCTKYYHTKNEIKCGYEIFCKPQTVKAARDLNYLLNEYICFLEYLKVRGVVLGFKEYLKKIKLIKHLRNKNGH